MAVTVRTPSRRGYDRRSEPDPTGGTLSLQSPASRSAAASPATAASTPAVGTRP